MSDRYQEQEPSNGGNGASDASGETGFVARLDDEPERWGPVREDLSWKWDPDDPNEPDWDWESDMPGRGPAQTFFIAPKRPWANPETVRRRIGTKEELTKVAEAIVLGRRLVCKNSTNDADCDIVGEVGRYRSIGLTRHVIVEDLQALINAVQAHRDARLARVELDENFDLVEGVWGSLRVRRRWVELNGKEKPDVHPTRLVLWRCVVERARLMNFDIACTLEVSAYFAGIAAFNGARFNTFTDFSNTHFINYSQFHGARFASIARFTGARFAKDATFTTARFADGAYFEHTIFTANAQFGGASFADEATFTRSEFAESTSFERVRFASVAFFGSVTFKQEILFDAAHFRGEAGFNRTVFATVAGFDRVHFARLVQFDGAWFGGQTNFHHTEFDQDVSFVVSVQSVGEVTSGLKSYQSARITQSGRVEFLCARFRRSVSFDGALIEGSLFFTESTLDERLTFVGTQISSKARLGMNRFLARGGATIELKREHLDVEAARRKVIAEDKRRRHWRQLPLRSRVWEAFRPVCHWLGACRDSPFMEGDDHWNIHAMERAAHDHDLLAANYRNQPATDWEEDWCRWRGHELRRLIRWMQWRRDASNFFDSSECPQLTNPLIPLEARWMLEYVLLIVSILAGYTSLASRAMVHIVWEWLVLRTMIGFILQVHRIIVAGAMIMLLCGLLYATAASESTIAMSTNAGTPAYEQGGLWGRLLFGMYFSLTTFVTLGYGDYAPTGWLKLVTGLEALAGVTLLALFTVAWGRKMVR